MSVHYDIAASSARLREELAKTPIDDKTEDSSRIKFRNPEALVGLQELIMGELNKGTPAGDIADAVLEITSDMMLSMVSGKPEVLAENIGLFTTRFHGHLLRRASGIGLRKGVHCPVISEPGGHA